MAKKKPILSVDQLKEFGLEESDFSPNWDKVANIAKHDNAYKIEVIKALSEVIGSNYKSEEEDSASVKKSIDLGIAPEEFIDGTEEQMEIHIKENFLKDFQRKGSIKNLKIGVRQIIPDKDFPTSTNIINASFSYTPRNLKRDIAEAEKELTDSISPQEKEFYIIKKGTDYYFDGGLIKIGRRADYRTVFDCLYDLRKEGGFVPYEELGSEIKKRIPRKKQAGKSEMQKFIRENLLEHNGFLRRAKVGKTSLSKMMPGGRRLIEIERSEGITFNNKRS